MTSTNGPTSTSSSGKNKRKSVRVVLLTGEQLVIHVDVKGKLFEVFNQVAAHLSLRETEYFGLAILRDEEYQFLILDEKISKLAPKKWKSGPGEGLDSDGKPLFTVWFRVQFYVDQVVLLREKVTRHLYYLQLKENILKYNHLYNEEKCFQIVGFALQADHGNFIADKHTAGYFDPRQYFPAWMIEKRGVDYLSSNSPLVHQDLHNVTRTDSELKYVRECSTAPGAHNLHFYRVRKKKTDKACNTWLAICPRGVEVYEDDAGFKNLISTFLWPDIGRLVFDKKKFEIRSVGSAGGRKFAYYTDGDVTSKYLLHICRSTHMFQMAIQPKLMEIRHLDAEDKKRYRESYIYSDVRDLHANSNGPIQYRSASKSPGKSPAGTQRYSVISDASSNTTSGIVSDKMAISFDEEEPGKEIIIDCPPRSSLHGTPGQAHPKPIRGSYKMTPPTPGSRSPALPPQSLELFRSAGSGGKGSPVSLHLQELSPASSNGSYRAKLQQTSHGLYSVKPYHFSTNTPSPSSPGQPYSMLPVSSGNPSPSSPREREMPVSVGRSTSLSKGVAGMLMNVERNVSGDSTATSGSTASAGLVSLSVESSPVTQPAHLGGSGQQYTIGGSPVASAGDSPSFSYSPASYACQQQQQQQQQSVLGGGFAYHYGLVEQQPQQHPVAAGQMGAGAAMLASLQKMRLGVAGSAAASPPMPPPQYPTTTPPTHHHHPSLPSPREHHLYTDRSKEMELRLRQEETVATAVTMPEAVLAPPPAFADSATTDSADHTHGLSSQSSGAVSSGSSCARGGGSSVDSGHVLSDESSCSAQHSTQSSEEDAGLKEAYVSEPNTPRGGGKSVPDVKYRNTPAKVKANSKAKSTHVSVKNQKEALHPDIEQILLGQSQAHSLPLITALCNDLMTGSAHSSTGSYDTSTLRSLESNSDSRRWSTCGPMETSVESAGSSGTMLVVGGAGSGTTTRPYSWHCEDIPLTVLPPHPLTQRKTPLPSSQLHHHLHHHHHHHLQPQLGLQQQQENAHSLPHDLCRAASTLQPHPHSVLWTQAVGGSDGGAGSALYGGSLDRYSPELIAQQLMIPSRLNSGGRAVGMTDSGHKLMKENIGIA